MLPVLHDCLRSVVATTSQWSDISYGTGGHIPPWRLTRGLPGRAVISTGFNGPGPRADEKRITHRAGPGRKISAVQTSLATTSACKLVICILYYQLIKEIRVLYAQNAFYFRVQQLTSLKYVKLKLQTTVPAKLVIQTHSVMSISDWIVEIYFS